MNVWVLPAVGLVATALLQLLLAGRLPSRIAVHWGPGGVPDASLPDYASLIFLTAAYGAFWIALIRSQLRRQLELGAAVTYRPISIRLVLIIGAGVLVALWFLSIRVGISGQGVRIGFGPFGWPAKTVRLERIQSAAVTTVRPLAWGGWGYRKSLRGRNTAVVIRGGEGLELQTSKGLFVVTIDGAAKAAAVVNGLLETLRR